MRILPSKAGWVVLTAAAICAVASNADAGGRGGFGPIWFPRGHLGPPPGHLGRPGGPGPGNGSEANNQGDGRWGHPGSGDNNGGRFPCGGGAGWGRGGGCWGGGYAGVGGGFGFVAAAPVDNGVIYNNTVIYEAVAYAPPADPSTSCWVQKLAYDYDGNFVGTHRIDACKIGPKVIDMSTAK